MPGMLSSLSISSSLSPVLRAFDTTSSGARRYQRPPLTPRKRAFGLKKPVYLQNRAPSAPPRNEDSMGVQPSSISHAQSSKILFIT